MCRHAAYIGPPVSLAKCLLEPEHNLVEQAANPREMRIGHVNADGFGIGWYLDDGTPATYKNILPVWSDSNLSALGQSLHRAQWIALVRGASPGLSVSIDNTHPFSDQRWLFTFNGIITDFTHSLRPKISARLSESVEAAIFGHTDAEYLFAVLRQLALENSTASTALLLQMLVRYVEEIAGNIEIALSILLCERGRLYAIRHAVNLPPPTLYYNNAYCSGQAVASEPLDDSKHWQTVPEESLLYADGVNPIQISPLELENSTFCDH